MTERDALLAAIRAHPEDDTPRLVFADWLDEHEPDAPRRAKKAKAAAPSAWAGLIRAECELARLADDGSASAAAFGFFMAKDEQSLRGVRWDRADAGVARRVELYTLANRLRGPSGKARNVGRPKEAMAFSWSAATHRGFPQGLTVDNGWKLAANLPALAARCPPVRVDFNVYTATALTNAGELVAAGLPRWCRELRVNARDPGHADLVVALSAHPDTANVHALYLALGDGPDSARALAAVADSPHWSGLRELTLEAEAAVSPEPLSRLFQAAHLRGLVRLTAHGRAPGGAVVLAARLGGLSELRTLALANCGLADGDTISLANSPALANLRHLDLQSNHFGGRGASALLASPHLTNLAVLDLDYNNPIRGLDRAALASAPAGGLRVVGFHGARLTTNDIAALTASPRLAELVYFDADYNELAESAVARMVKGFGERPPAVLYLRGNNIATAGVAALTNWPAAARVDMLHLAGNVLPTPAAKALASCPHLKGLKHLCAATTHPAGRKALMTCFGPRASV